MQWRTLSQLGSLPLPVFVRLLLAIPFGDVSENVFSEIILSYIDRRALVPSEALTQEDVYFLVGLIDTAVVTPDYLQCRLLDRLPTEKRSFLAELLPSFETLSYQFRCPLSMRHLSEDDGVLILPCGHHVTWTAWPWFVSSKKGAETFKCPMLGCLTTCTIMSINHGSNIHKRLLQHRKTKASRREVALQWLLGPPSSSSVASAATTPTTPTAKKQKRSQGSSTSGATASTAVSTHVLDLTPTTLEVIFIGTSEDDPMMLPLTDRLNSTVQSIVQEAATIKRLKHTDFLSYIPPDIAGGRIRLQMTINEYIATYFNDEVRGKDPSRFKSGCIPFYVSCYAIGG